MRGGGGAGDWAWHINWGMAHKLGLWHQEGNWGMAHNLGMPGHAHNLGVRDLQGVHEDVVEDKEEKAGMACVHDPLSVLPP